MGIFVDYLPKRKFTRDYYASLLDFLNSKTKNRGPHLKKTALLLSS